jgi:hypothetical protein
MWQLECRVTPRCTWTSGCGRLPWPPRVKELLKAGSDAIKPEPGDLVRMVYTREGCAIGYGPKASKT